MSENHEGNEWTVLVSRSDEIEVGEFCPRQPYLEAVVPELATSVRRLVLTTVSHDQGFSNSEQSNGGTYNDSHSGFEVAIVTPSYHERRPSKMFQYNVHALFEKCEHENVWDVASGDLTTRKWLADIQAGDIIQVIPRADFMLWVNYVYSATIQVEGEKRAALDMAATEPQNISSKPKFYNELDPLKRQVRILSLHVGQPDDPVACDVTTISLGDSVHDEQYEALSYCWGEASRKDTIRVRATWSELSTFQDFPVNSSLYEALVHLRPASGPGRRLWVNAICINQACDDERSQQVPQMASIYNLAKRVIIWLGALDATRRACLNKIVSIQEHLQQEYDASRTYTRAEMKGLEFRAVNAEISVNDLMGFANIWRECDFDWFKRTWVLQEVANARTAIVCSGSIAVTWPAFSAFARRMLDAKRGSPLIRYGVMPTVFFKFASFIDSHEDKAADPDEEILDFLLKAHSLKASDPRDKIFALLQFGHETSNVASLPPEIRPDYQKPVQRVFSDFVRWWILEHKSLRILSAVHTLQGRSWQQMYYGQPPDLKAIPYPIWCLWHGGEANWAKATLGLAPDAPYTASGSSTPDLALISSNAVSRPGVLRVRGHHLGTIAQIAPFPFWKWGNDLPRELFHAFVRIFNPTANMRVWLHDRDNQEIQRLDDQQESDFYDRHFTYHYSRGFQRESPAIPCYSDCLFTTNDGDGITDGFATDFATGHPGLCPHNALPGDVVVMLYGGSVLYLLRPVEGEDANAENEDKRPREFHFVGECFLHGYMHGEGLEDAREKGIRSEIFNLI
ncbi:heterokaryon incompatibility protein-domain-containing protein [Pseudomassariella vexata]|uniref:Heterokaryon incompatibility protein-domain-containing protein n=1 Tax=Pseudomassariella vexata TaxID=1141098 RepID=A0A1Y2DFC6_9PEZI|nr:heterokaryon incompatibility protein-domain-containing protein [Pseudomassariella vexata]ORY57846.1 heterokaryon incompatibility protein-domain-containing protein [Pseudomassariella vexata]